MVPIPFPAPSANSTSDASAIATNAPKDTDQSMTDATPQEQPQSITSTTLKKRKRKDKETPHILHQCTFRKTAWTYFDLRLITPATATPSTSHPPQPPPPPPSSTSVSTFKPLSPTATHPSPLSIPTATTDISPLTALPLLTAPLQSYLGTTGAAIPIDILRTQNTSVWIRVPRLDASAVRASLSGWVGSCEAENLPGGEGAGRVKVAWRVVGEGGVLGLLISGGDGDGRWLFGG